MSLPLTKLFKTAAIVVFCGLLAACQTTGLKPGSIQTNYSPSGWTKRSANGVTGYVCEKPQCKSERLIGYGPVRVSGNMEQAIKDNTVSKELFNAVANVYNVAAKGSEKMTITRRIVTRDYAGFDFTGYFTDPKGRVWVTGRYIVQENRGSVLFSAARSRSVANSYFRKYMGKTTIKRLP